MKRVCLAVLVFLLAAASAGATDLNIAVRGPLGASSVTVGPGGTVPYTVVGTLSDSLSDGLAMFSFNLAFSGGPLTPAANPTTSPINNFATPLGITNPAGFGGTVQGGVLVQVGGAQNTINNTIAPVPNGSVLTGVAQPTNPVVLASGTLTAPYQVGTFTLDASALFANVLEPGQTGVPFWKVDPAGVGSIQGLVVEVSAINANATTVSIAAGATQILSIDAGPANAGRTFWMLGSFSGNSPGIALGGGLTLPLNPDSYFHYTRINVNTPTLQNSFGTLDAQGRATVIFAPNRRFIGQPVSHAFMLRNPIDFVSEPQSCTIVN